MQDWFHESCLNLRERPSSREPSAAPPSAPSPSTCSSAPSTVTTTDPTSVLRELEVAEDASDTSSTEDLPPALLPGSSYDTLICGGCARNIPPLRAIAGTPGALVVLRDAPDAAWRVVGLDERGAGMEVDVTGHDDSTPGASSGTKGSAGMAAGAKRARSPEVEVVVPPKRPRGDSPLASVSEATSAQSPAPSSCVAPPLNPLVQPFFANNEKTASDAASRSHAPEGTGDVFLTEGWRERWCRCPSVSLCCTHCVPLP